MLYSTERRRGAGSGAAACDAEGAPPRRGLGAMDLIDWLVRARDGWSRGSAGARVDAVSVASIAQGGGALHITALPRPGKGGANAGIEPGVRARFIIGGKKNGLFRLLLN